MELFDMLRAEQRFFLIAGPCVVEDLTIMHKIAEKLVTLTQKRNIKLVFKASFQKANRTSIESYSGPGTDEGLRILSEIKSTYNVPILTDIHETIQVKAAAEVADILQIPAFLSRQTYLISEAAKSGRIINIKKGQFMAPEDMSSAIGKVTAENNFQVLLTERGTTFGYHNLVVDFRSFAIMNSMRYPVVYDVTHSLQLPSVNQVSGGNPEYAHMMARAAIATGYVRGLFLETHPNPSEALSDAASMISLDEVESLIDSCLRVAETVPIIEVR